MAEDLDDTITRLVSLRFASQRFNTIADLSAKIILNIAPIFEFLLHLSIEGGHDAQWAKNLMDEVYTPGNLLLMALVAEMSDIANRFSRRFDGVEGQGDRNSRLIKSAAWTECSASGRRKGSFVSRLSSRTTGRLAMSRFCADSGTC